MLPMWIRRLGCSCITRDFWSALARLLARPLAEWLQVMDRQDVLVAAMQLQRDAGLLSNCT